MLPDPITSLRVKLVVLTHYLEGDVVTWMYSNLKMFYCPVGLDCVDQHGCLSDHILKVSKFKVPHPVKSCVLGVSDVFAHCHRRKTLQRFQLPQVCFCLSILCLHPPEISLEQINAEHKFIIFNTNGDLRS